MEEKSLLPISSSRSFNISVVDGNLIFILLIKYITQDYLEKLKIDKSQNKTA